MYEPTSNSVIPDTSMFDDRWEATYVLLSALLFLSFLCMNLYLVCGVGKSKARKPNKAKKASEPGLPSAMESEYPPGMEIDKVIRNWKEKAAVPARR